MIVTSCLNFKGGTGKSTVTQNLGAALSHLGYRILLIDGDRQSNTSITLLGERKTPSLRTVILGDADLRDAIFEARPNLFVISSDTHLDRVAAHLREERHAFYLVRDALAALPGFDLTLIDHAGAFTPVMEALLLASSHILIPCVLEPYSVSGIFDMQNKLALQLRDHALSNAGIIPYNVNLSYTMARTYQLQLREAFGDLVIPPVRTDANISKAQSVKMTIFEYEQEYSVKSRAADDFRLLAQFLSEQLLRRGATV